MSNLINIDKLSHEQQNKIVSTYKKFHKKFFDQEVTVRDIKNIVHEANKISSYKKTV